MYRMPNLAAPERLGLKEVLRLLRITVRTIPEIRRQVREWRLPRLPEVRNGKLAAWALVVPPQDVTRFIEDGRLRARRVFDPRGWYRWEIDREQIEALADELDA
jgi:hypothetical protein